MTQAGRITLLAIGLSVLCGCDLSPKPPQPKGVAGGDPARGLALIASGAHGCTACHDVPGVSAPRGVVGPPLEGMARRVFIGGQIPNEPGVMVAFLQDPPALLPQTAMPNVGLNAAQARDMAAYLYTLEQPDAR
jgi:cytochrome c1